MTHFPLYSKCKTDNRTNTAVGFFFNQIVLEEKYIVQNTFKIQTFSKQNFNYEIIRKCKILLKQLPKRCDLYHYRSGPYSQHVMSIRILLPRKRLKNSYSKRRQFPVQISSKTLNRVKHNVTNTTRTRARYIFNCLTQYIRFRSRIIGHVRKKIPTTQNTRYTYQRDC